MTANYLAFDLGAESGRAILGRVRSGVLDIEEVHRFPNQPLRDGATLRWNAPGLFAEMQRALAGDLPQLSAIGVDAWGVDYALVDEDGALVESPYHYRDARTDDVMDRVFTEVARERLYSITGIQFIRINTLYQLYAALHTDPAPVTRARALLMIPDLFHYWLTGRLCCEFTDASTTQLIDAKSRGWAAGLMQELGLPERLFQPIVEPGTELGRLANGTAVIAPACHDTGSAVAAIPLTPESAYISSGTWSLLGAEIEQPILTPRACELNFTNEGGVCGTTRLLKNIGGLWLLQQCRQCWKDEGREYTYDELLAAADDQSLAFGAFFDVDDTGFSRPENMAQAIADYCAATGQTPPVGAAAMTRAILENLAFKYRMTLDSLEEIAGVRFREIRIVGGGSRNRLLNQFTANATGRAVVAGPAEATALGNILMQMLATGAVSSLAEGRAVIDRSFPAERFEPADADRWERQYGAFRQTTQGATARVSTASPK